LSGVCRAYFDRDKDYLKLLGAMLSALGRLFTKACASPPSSGETNDAVPVLRQPDTGAASAQTGDQRFDMSANAQLRKRREAAKSRYAPKPKPPASAPRLDPDEVRLKRIVARTLEELKQPAAIPSEVLLRALKEARNG
jgi:hypothetical protein